MGFIHYSSECHKSSLLSFNIYDRIFHVDHGIYILTSYSAGKKKKKKAHPSTVLPALNWTYSKSLLEKWTEPLCIRVGFLQTEIIWRLLGSVFLRIIGHRFSQDCQWYQIWYPNGIHHRGAPLTLEFKRPFDCKSSHSNNIPIIMTAEKWLDQINQLKCMLSWFHSNKSARVPEKADRFDFPYSNTLRQDHFYVNGVIDDMETSETETVPNLQGFAQEAICHPARMAGFTSKWHMFSEFWDTSTTKGLHTELQGDLGYCCDLLRYSYSSQFKHLKESLENRKSAIWQRVLWEVTTGKIPLSFQAYTCPIHLTRCQC